MTYVALSRVRKLSDLVLEPSTFERLQAPKKSPNLQYIISEEKRLDLLSQGAKQDRHQIQSSFICQRILHIGRRHGHNGTPHMGTVIYTTEKQQGVLLSKPLTTVLSRIKIP